ncbi:hypothetical protein Ancab_010961 [Ancistrocladus abbreviatus]
MEIKLAEVQINDLGADVWVWKEEPSGCYTVKSAYSLIRGFHTVQLVYWLNLVWTQVIPAASVKVSNELGAGNPNSDAFSVATVTGAPLIIAILEAAVVLALRHVTSYAFTNGEILANAVSELWLFLAVFLILIGVQPVLSGVAVGRGWQAFVAFVNMGCFYIVGVPLGCLLAFIFYLGAKELRDIRC